MEKEVLYWKIILLKITFFTEKKNENVKNITFQKYIFTQKIIVLQKNLWGYLFLVTLKAVDLERN